MSVSAIFAAAGEGMRFGGEIKKPFVTVLGRPILLHTIERFAAVRDVRERVLAVHPDDVDDVRRRLGQELSRLGVHRIVAGGPRRQDSVRAALGACQSESRLILVHDAVRPLSTPAVIEAAIEAARKAGAALVAVPLTDTLKLADGEGRVIRTAPRAELWRAQTPQVFARDLLERAFAEVERRGLSVSHDAEMLEAIGVKPVLVPGSPQNIKITEPEDLALLEALLERERKGP